MFHQSDLVLALAAISIMTAMYLLALKFNSASEGRTSELQLARSMMVKHVDARRLVMNSEQMPDRIKEVVAWLSRSMNDATVSHQILDAICNSREEVPSQNRKAEAASLFEGVPPSELTKLNIAIMTALFAMTFRWEKNAALAEALLAQITVSSKEQTMTVIRFAHGKQSMGGLAGTHC